MKSYACGVIRPFQNSEPSPQAGWSSTITAGSIKRMTTARPGQSTNRLSAKQPDRIGGVAGEAPFRVFRYAPASSSVASASAEKLDPCLSYTN